MVFSIFTKLRNYQKRILVRWSGKHQKVLLPLDNNCTGRICLIQLFGSLESTEGFHFPGRRFGSNCGYFWSVSALCMVAATYPLPQPHGRQLCRQVFQKQFSHSLWELEWAKSTLSSRYWGSVLWLLLLLPEVQREGGNLCCIPTPIVAVPSPFSWSDF